MHSASLLFCWGPHHWGRVVLGRKRLGLRTPESMVFQDASRLILRYYWVRMNPWYCALPERFAELNQRYRKEYMMSGNTYYVGGIEVARLSSDPLPDEVICSVFYQMAEFANDASVRQTLQIEMSQNGALELPPVSVSNSYEQERTRAATITGGPLQVRLPQATSGPDLALDTRDLSICTAILKRTDLIEDALLRASAQNGAKAGLERIAEVLAQNVTHYQALGAAEIVDEVFSKGDLAAGEDESLERKSFELALAIATEPSKLGQLRQMLVHLHVQRGLPEDFSTWALGQIDER